ncbi:MAG: hypothetical protein WDM86_00480 [Rhizomicrobium sp.]
MSVYLDTSVIVPLFLPDPFIARVRSFLSTGPSGLIVGVLPRPNLPPLSAFGYA